MPFATRLLLVLGLLGAALVPAASAAVPSPANSTLDPCLVASPDGTLLFNVVVRDIAGNPVNASYVALDFSRCPAAVFCPTACTGCSVDPSTRTVLKPTNATGSVSFDLKVGGGCAAGTVWVLADGIQLGTRALASLDQDGDLSVTAADLALVNAKLGSHDVTADFDCSGLVDGPDVALLQGRLGSTCAGIVSTAPRTWGGLKIRYR